MNQEKKSNFIHTKKGSEIVTSTIYKLGIPGEYSEKYSYSRYGNPTRDALESSLAHLDSANYALTYSSKTAGSFAVLSSLNANDSIILNDALSCEKFKDFGIKAEYTNFDDLKSFESSLNSSTKIVWIESLTALMSVVDIKVIADIVHTKSKALLVVDNSLLTQCLQRPLELGADAVIYSLGEFIEGHGDVTAGAVITNDQKLYEELKYQQYAAGAIPSPFDCYIINRSLKTLPLRMEKHSKNAEVIANFLKNHLKVDKVFHPSLKLNGFKNLSTQFNENCGVVSFNIKGSSDEAKSFINSLKTIPTTENIGGVDSSVSLPWSMSHSHLPEDKRKEIGLTRNYVRLSIGIEDVEALVADIDQALIKVTNTLPTLE